MALLYPNSPTIPRYGGALDGILEGMEIGDKRRKDFNAQQAFEGNLGAKQPNALERLMGLFGGNEQPQGPYTRPQPPMDAVAAIDAAAPQSSIPTGYQASVRAAESGGNDAAKNPNSSATGRYQFLEGTWNDLAAKYPALGLTPEGRTDPAQQERAMAQFTQDNARVLAGAGVPVNPGTLYAAHFLGAGGATKALMADPNTPMSALVDPGVVEANPHLAKMTAGDFSQWASSKGGNGSGGYSAPMPYDQPSAGQMRQFTREELGAMMASETYRPLAMQIFQMQQQQGANAGRYELQEMPDGSIRQVDRMTGQVQILQDAPTPAAPDARPLTPEERDAWGIPAEDTNAYSIVPGEAPKRIGGSGQTINVTTGDQDSALNKSLSAKEGEAWSGYKDSAAVSASNAQDFEILGELLTLAPQGPIEGRLANMFQGVSSAGDAVNSIVKRIAPTLRAPGSGSTSDIEYDGMLRSLPSLLNAPEANAMILSIMQAKAQINMERGRIVTAYQNDEMTIAEARAAMDELNRRSIMTPEMKRALIGLGSDGAVGTTPPEVGEIVDGYRYEGGDPSSPTSWTQVN